MCLSLFYSENEEILRRLDETKGPYLFTSDDLSKLIEVTTSIRTKISIIGQIGPRLVDPKSKTTYFTGLFRYAEEKSAVEEILKARQQTLASAMFAKTDNVRSQSGRGFGGRSPAGRGGAGRGPHSRAGSRAGSNTSLEKDMDGSTDSAKKEALNILRITSEDETLHPTESGFDDVISALDDLAPTKKNTNVKKSPAQLNVIDESADDTPNSSSYSIVDPKTTNDNSSVESNGPVERVKKTKTLEDDGKLVLNKIESSATIVLEAPKILIEERSSTTARTSAEEEMSSISSIESGKSNKSLNSRTRTIGLKSASYAHFSPENPKSSSDTVFSANRSITKKYSEAAIRHNQEEQEVSHEAISTVPGTVAERTKAISNPLLNKKAQQTPPPQPTVGKVLATYPFSPIKSPAEEVKPQGPADCPKIGKLNLIYPFANNKQATTTTTSSVPAPKAERLSLNLTRPQPTTKVTSYIPSSSRSLASHSSDNESIGSLKSSKSTDNAPRCGTPRLTGPPANQPALPVLSNYIPEKATAAGTGNFNADFATKCATALKLTKEEFLELTEQPPVRIIDGLEKHTYCELVRRNFAKNYGNLQQNELEKYLIEEDFPAAFSKTMVSE